MTLEKQIDWDGYTIVYIRCVERDGSFLCNLYNPDTGKSDTNISFPSTTTIFTLTQEEYDSLDKSCSFLP